MYDTQTQAALIEFARVVPGATVVDVYPGDGDWTRLFSEAVGPEGEVVSFVPAEITDIKPDQLDQMRAIAREAADQNIAPLSADLLELSKVSPQADVVWLHLFYHDLHTALIQKRGASADGFTKAVLATLKPGGCLVVVDHAATVGSQLDATQSLHRIDPETVRKEIEAVGFTFDAATAILANASDPHTNKVFDPAIKGKTDRMAYRFLKR